MRLRRAEEIETLSYRTVVELNAESRLGPQRRVATSPAGRNAPNAWSASGPAAPTAASSSASPAATGVNAPAGRTRSLRNGEWQPMPADPAGPDRSDGQARFRADLVAYRSSGSPGALARSGPGFGVPGCAAAEPIAWSL